MMADILWFPLVCDGVPGFVDESPHEKKQTNKKTNPHANMLMLITGTEVGGLHGKKNVHGGGSARTPPRGMHKRGGVGEGICCVL